MTDDRNYQELVGDAYDAVPAKYNGIPLDEAVRQMAEELQSLRKLHGGLRDELNVKRAEAARVAEILGRQYVGWTTPDIIQALLASQDTTKEVADYYAGALAAIPYHMRHLTLKEAVKQLEPLTKQVEILQSALASEREERDGAPAAYDAHWRGAEGTDRYDMIIPLPGGSRKLRITVSVVDGLAARLDLRVIGPNSSSIIGRMSDVSTEAVAELLHQLAELKTTTRLEAR